MDNKASWTCRRKSCKYHTEIRQHYACNYLLYMQEQGHFDCRRGCPSGDECTKYVKDAKVKLKDLDYKPNMKGGDY